MSAAQPKKSAAAAAAGPAAGKQQQQSGGKTPTPTPTTPQPQSSPSAAAASAASSAAAAAAVAFVPMLPPPSQLLPGATLRIRTSMSPASFDAVLFVFDAAASLLVVERSRGTGDWEDAQADNESSRDQGPVGEGKKDFAILNAKQIRVELLTPAASSGSKPKPLPPLSQEAIQCKAAEGMQRRMEEKNSLGVGVTPEGQKLFDAIRKTSENSKTQSSPAALRSAATGPRLHPLTRGRLFCSVVTALLACGTTSLSS